MAKVISISNQKGGVGKTTTTNALTAGLKAKGFRVLAIDLDPQGNLSFSLGADNENQPTIYHVMKQEITAIEAIQHTEIADVIAGNILLSSLEVELSGTGREFVLKEALEPVHGQYDYILLDTPPALSILTINAFTASDTVIVPMLADIFSLQSIAQLNDTIVRVRKYCNPTLSVSGILLTKYNNRTVLSREIKDTAQLIADNLQIPLFETFIRNSVTIAEAHSLEANIFDYAPKNNAVQDYQAFIDEFLDLQQKGRC